MNSGYSAIQINFKQFIKEKLTEINYLGSVIKQEISDIDRMLAVNRVEEIDNTIQILKMLLDNLDNFQKDIENYTGKFFCPWGDEEMIYHDCDIIAMCIGNTKSDLETIVWDFYNYSGNINRRIYELNTL